MNAEEIALLREDVHKKVVVPTYVQSIVDLRWLPAFGLQGGELVMVEGPEARPYVWVPTATGTDDGWGTVTPVGQTGAGRWLALSPRVVMNSVAIDLPNLADGDGHTEQINLTNAEAELGDFVLASLDIDLQGITVTAYIAGPGVLQVRFQNETGGALDLGAANLRFLIVKVL